MSDGWNGEGDALEAIVWNGKRPSEGDALEAIVFTVEEAIALLHAAACAMENIPLECFRGVDEAHGKLYDIIPLPSGETRHDWRSAMKMQRDSGLIFERRGIFESREDFNARIMRANFANMERGDNAVQ